ncbi:SGNH/GDSL hydrolase family protein [Aeromicrobium flavum]|uniref:SGNH/GDSL hydrolase family protein n=1 Tax=Aeromicrobium flavum TaxID=416568 RepID=UPI001649E083|nr:SGNH/GDSL hydrolase family protein [Aeromicrobium flavum]
MPVAPFPVRVAVAATALLAVAGGCSTPADPFQAPSGQYLAIGDSYSAGFRPSLDGEPPATTNDGFAWQVADATGLELVNVSCSGITTTDFVSGRPCAEDLRGDDAPDRTDGSEASTVLGHVDRHPDEIELVTVVLGTNDLRPCTSFGPRWRECVARVLPRVERALDRLLSDLRERLGPSVPIVGLTYPDVWAAEPVREPDAPRSPLVTEASVELFRDHLNPMLRRTYAGHGARFADVTEEFGGYLPVERRTTAGEVPARAALICTETYYCARDDGHPNPRGHERIADLVLETLRPR